MKTFCPFPKKFSALLIALIFTGILNAQEKSYASVTKQNISSSYTSDRSVIAEPVIKLRSRSDKKIVLIWPAFKGEVSHYVLERSTDGRSFQESGLFFTNEWGDDPEYVFADRFRSSYLGPLYYRLRVVGFDGSEIYTPVTLINAEK